MEKCVKRCKNLPRLTASLLITVVGAVVISVAHLRQGNAVAVVAPELGRGAGGCRRAAHVLQLVRPVPAVVVAVAGKVVRNAAAVLAGELVLLARLVSAALLVAAVAAVVASVAPSVTKVNQNASFIFCTHLFLDWK